MPGALAVIGGLAALMFALGGTEAHGWMSVRTITAIVTSVTLLAAFVLIQLRARHPPGSTASRTASFATIVLPGLLVLGLGVGMVFVSVSVTAMAGIPAQHAGLASGFLMTGHEVGAALGVAVLSAVATTAGGLTSPPGVVAGFSRAFVAAGIAAVLLAVVSFVRMPCCCRAGRPPLRITSGCSGKDAVKGRDLPTLPRTSSLHRSPGR